jgi:hypothetical protein
MSGLIGWIAAEADGGDGVLPPEDSENRAGGQSPEDGLEETRNRESQLLESRGPHFSHKKRDVGQPGDIRNLPAHTFPVGGSCADVDGEPGLSVRQSEAEDSEQFDQDYEAQRARRIYRGRTVAMLRRYMRYSIETGRLPSLLGREFFRTQVTSYTVVTFEDRVIFVHDMEKCLERLDEFSRQIIARHVLQEHDQEATGRLLGCSERTVRTYVPIVIDLFSEILLEVGLLERVGSK